MTDLEKAARMALEALGYYEVAGLATTRVAKSITALRQALSNSVEQPAKQRHIAYVCPQCYWTLEEQPAQQSAERGEPVDWEAVAADQAMTIAMMKSQRKPWVGLTDEEIARVVSLAGFAPDWAEANIATQIVRVCQDMLKEKNTK
jgi:hypothetical protein